MSITDDSGLRYGVIYDEILLEGPTQGKFLIDDREVWLPWSEVELYEEEKRVEMPEWLMFREGLEGYSDDYPK